MEGSAHRACAHCKSQKVRCIIDEEKTDACQRCARLGRPCVFTPLQKRKQRKRTDTRVAELEREMRTMRAMLRNKQQSADLVLETENGAVAASRPAGLPYTETTQNDSRWTHAATGVAADRANKRKQMQNNGNGAALWPEHGADRLLTETQDVVDSGILSMATARQLFETYRRDLFPFYPMVAIPDSTSAEQMRQTKPTLFLAIIAAAAGKQDADLSATLDQRVLHAYATRNLVRSEKSLELVQALLISAVWYSPPNKFGQLKYYEYIHMAATMAMDIGIGTRPVHHRSRLGSRSGEREGRRSGVHPLEDATNPDLSMTPRSRDTSPDTGSIESRRTFLACYATCAGVSMSLRRPNMLRVNSYVRECIEYLERSPDSIPTDRRLVAWVKLIAIGEEINNSFCYDDPGGIASITDLRTQMMLRDYQRRLSEWHNKVHEPDMNGSLTIMYYATRLYLHEIALHVDHSPEDFKAPYQMGIIHPWDGEEIPTQILAEAVAECISCAHSILNTFLGMEPEQLRALPVLAYVRVSFAAFVLAKLCQSSAISSSRIGKVLDRSSLQIEHYMDRAILHVRAIVEPVRCRVPAIFLALLFKLRQWCMNPAIIEEFRGDRAPLDLGPRPKSQQPQPRGGASASIEGPRVVEHLSGDESSPQTSVGSQAGTYNVIAGGASDEDMLATASLPFGRSTPGSERVNQIGTIHDHSTASIAVDAIAAASTSASGFNMPQRTPYLGSNDQMVPDQASFQYFGAMDGLLEGGLTGLDDWSSLPTDFMGLPDNFGWSDASVGEMITNT